MNTNKRQLGLLLLKTCMQGVLIFFTPRALRLLGALGYAPINSPPTLQHICKPTQAHAQSKGFQKSCNFAIPPLLNLTSLESMFSVVYCAVFISTNFSLHRSEVQTPKILQL